MAPIKEIVTVEQFEADVLQAPANTLVVVDFWGPWCMPCKQLLPHIEKYQDEFKSVIFRKYNIGEEELGEFAASIGVGSLPCVLLYKNGKQVHQFQGNREQKLRSDIEANL